MQIKLTSERYAPWGLLNDMGEILIWLTDSKRVVEIDERSLGENQINSIKHDLRNNVLSVKDATFLDQVILAPKLEVLPFRLPEVPKANVEPSNVDMEKVNQVLEGKVAKVLEKLEIAREDKNITLSFFNVLKKTEKEKKNRKTVVERIIEISIEKLAEIKTPGIVVDKHSSTFWLSNQYENLIELTYDDDEEKKEEEGEEEENEGGE